MPKPSDYIRAQLDISSILPQTPNTEFEELLYFNKSNNIQTPSDYYIVPRQANLTDVVVSSNPPLNQLDSSANVEFEKMQVYLTESKDMTTQDLTPEKLILPTQSNGVICSVVDPLFQYAYFGSPAFPTSGVTKVNLNTLEAIQTIQVSLYDERVALIDPVGQFAYFAGFDSTSFKGRIVKVNLDTFEEQASLNLDPSQEQVLTCGVMNPSGQFAYFGTSSNPSRIVKIDLVTFTRSDALVLAESSLFAAVVDRMGTFAYFSAAGDKLVKMNLATFTIVATLTLQPNETFRTMSIDPFGTFLYGGNTAISVPIVTKVNLTTFSRVGSISLPSGGTYCSAVDSLGQFAYFGTGNIGGSNIGTIYKIQLSTFTLVNTLATTSSNLVTVVSRPDVDLIFGTFTRPATLRRLALSTFTETQTTLLLGTYNICGGVIDNEGNFGYFISQDFSSSLVRFSTVTKVNLRTFSFVEIVQATAPGIFTCCTRDPAGQFLYAGTIPFIGEPSRVIKFSLNPLSEIANITFPLNTYTSVAITDPLGQYAYFGTTSSPSSPATIYKVDLASFTFAGTLTLNSGENDVRSVVIDSLGQYAYFGTNTTPGRVVKIDLQTFTRVGAITLNSGENLLFTATIDTQDRYAYFGTSTSPGKVVRIDLLNFVQFGTITLNSGENFLVSSALEPSEQFMYFGTATNPGKVVKINVQSFSRVGATTLEVGDNECKVILMNPVTSEMHVGTYTNPGRVVRLSTIDNILISGLSQPGFTPGNLENTTTVVDIDNKSQQLKQTQNNRVQGNYYLALYVKGKTGALLNPNPCTIQTLIKLFG